MSKRTVDDRPVWRDYDPAVLIPDRARVLRLLGIPADAVERELDKLAVPFEKALSLFVEQASPRGGFLVVDPAVELEPLFAFSPGSKLRVRLLEAERASLFLATVGEGPERHAASLFKKGEYLLGTMLDTVASEAVECLVDSLQEEVAREWIQKKALRFSPGYGGWSLEIQPYLLEKMRADGHGISLTEAFMMVPKKSVSGVIVPRKPREAQGVCHICDLGQCARHKP